MKNIEKSSNKSERRFTVIDLILGLVIIFAVVYIGIGFFTSDPSGENANVQYTVTLIIPDERISNLNKGDSVLTSNGERIIGKITNIYVSDATEKRIDYTVHDESDSLDDAEIIYDVPLEGYNSVTVEISAELDYKSGRYFLNGEPLQIDSQVEVTTSKFSAFGKCESVLAVE